MESQVQDLASLIMSQASIGDPIRYANIIKATRSEDLESIRKLLPIMKDQLEKYEQTTSHAKEFRRQVSGQDYARRRKDSKKVFDTLDQQQDLFKGSGVDLSLILDAHFESINQIYSVLVQGSEMMSNARMVTLDESISSWGTELNNNSDLLGEDRIKALLDKQRGATADALNSLAMEQKINSGASQNFIQGLMLLEKIPKMYETYLFSMSRLFEAYYERLRHRHANGLVICQMGAKTSVSLTDVSLLVWENLDKVGEIESGQSKDELSAYTVHRAAAMIEAAKNNAIWPWISDPGEQLLAWAHMMLPTIRSIRNVVLSLKSMLGESIWKLSSVSLGKLYKEYEDVIESLDLDQITQRPPDRVVSKTEKFALEHKNKSVQRVADLLYMGIGVTEIVNEVLSLKVEERNYFVNENSFYVCRIGTGNIFSGEAPGALEIIPGEKPNASLEYIWGGGFNEMKEFISGMDEARKWQPLFLSTSPSQSTDKNNILLVGPMGCGKTELMRAIGCAPGNIAIFAVGSSFLTAWMGESQKNPARLFDEAVKLHKNSGRPVYILIDEIDSVLNEDRTGTTRVNLSTEFQNLMDGVVAYPGLTVVGATNHPEKIPTPMLRRFAKVMVVGELNEEDANHILKHYIHSFLPCDDGFTDEVYQEWFKKLEGATGDSLRKIVDEVWLTFMRSFITNQKEAAEKIISYITDKFGDSFQVQDLKEEHRSDIKKMISETGYVVSVKMVDDQINKMLNNFAFQELIKKAKETYKNSRLLLERQQAGNKGLGF
jgi:hypothetical protein